MGKTKVGQRLFFDMHPDGANAWTGKAVNPGNGSIYSGKIHRRADPHHLRLHCRWTDL
jgi:uncharacterized protein (DUF2147 family)